MTYQCLERCTFIAANARAKKPLSIGRLAAELETSYKTIQRDMDFMRDRLGMPLAWDNAEKIWRLDKSAKLPWFWL